MKKICFLLIGAILTTGCESTTFVLNDDPYVSNAKYYDNAYEYDNTYNNLVRDIARENELKRLREQRNIDSLRSKLAHQDRVNEERRLERERIARGIEEQRLARQRENVRREAVKRERAYQEAQRAKAERERKLRESEQLALQRSRERIQREAQQDANPYTARTQNLTPAQKRAQEYKLEAQNQKYKEAEVRRDRAKALKDVKDSRGISPNMLKDAKRRLKKVN